MEGLGDGRGPSWDRHRQAIPATCELHRGPMGLVFTTKHGTPIEPRTVNRMFRTLTDAADLRPVRVHDLRHGCVSLLLSLGVPPRTVMQIVGHTVMEMTMERYGHVNLADQREALSLLDQALR